MTIEILDPISEKIVIPIAQCPERLLKGKEDRRDPKEVLSKFAETVENDIFPKYYLRPTTTSTLVELSVELRITFGMDDLVAVKSPFNEEDIILGVYKYKD